MRVCRTRVAWDISYFFLPPTVEKYIERDREIERGVKRVIERQRQIERGVKRVIERQRDR